MRPNDINDQIRRLLEAAAKPGSKNILTIQQINEGLLDYLEMRAEEVERGFEMPGEPHWDLLAADWDLDDEAFFVAGYFADGKATLVAGRGALAEVREFGDNFSGEPPEVIPQLAAHFGLLGGTVSFDQPTFETWLRAGT